MRYETIRTEVEDGILTLTLDRPDALNAFNGRMMDELLHAFDAADADDAVRAIVVTGAGRAFCAGADLSGGGSTFDSGDAAREHRDGGGRVVLRIYDVAKPVIAAINGAAVGVGITMCLPMDVRIVSERSKIGFVFARRGIPMEACSSWFLPRLVGISQAMEWVATGRVFGADEALRGGLASRVVPPEEVLPTAHALAREMSESTSALSIAFSRQLMWKMLGADHPMEAHRLDSRCIHHMGSSDDAREGVTSFLEKRPARFPLRVPSDLPDFYPWWEDRPFRPGDED